ncbi:response regulator transcription factor [Aliikangiella coralliicola]|uniref:Response regulator n=1 Tax=Aliikangiella coralliicola TaxID=2592383 RepID=A0A545UJY1_9GAMM|nr:response regulator [Aliikangiella coralliicola]TQV89753.1 response regulator [Aliikangiella coralliicola]
MSKKILIVDDSLVSRMMIKEIVMSRHPDWECSQAASADKALEACQVKQFDFITLDLNMPGKNGLDAAPEIIATQKDAKIALLTANIQSATKQKATDIGLAFVAKPVTEEGVLDFVGYE